MTEIQSRRQFDEVEEKIYALCRANDVDRLFVLTDTNVDALTGDFLKEAPRLVVSAGEGSKSVEGLTAVWRFLTDMSALRRSLLVNVGGGMVTDLGGFAAATFKRGIRHVNVATTLLAAVDAAIGGKTGINFAGLKNQVGAFAMPLAVYPLTCLFRHLPQEEWLSGAGEAIKTGLLDSLGLFELATSEAFLVRRDAGAVEEVTRRCAEFKEKIVNQDFKEGGLRRILNLGHTMGHAIEAWKMAQGEPMPHGVAVAHGLRRTLERSCREAGFPKEIAERYEQVVEKYFPPLGMDEKALAEAETYMAHDKKNRVAGRPEWVLLSEVGEIYNS